MKTLPRALVAAATLACVAGAPARAEEPPGSLAPPAAPQAYRDEADTGRVLGGHVFMPAAVVPGALLTTSFASALRVGAGSTTASLTVGNRTFEGSMQYAGVGGVLAFEASFLRYFSARVWLDEMLYSGTTGRSAVVVGTTGQLGVGAGVTAAIPLGSSARVGILFDASSRPSGALTIGSAIQDVITSCQTTGCDPGAGSVFVQENVVAYQPAIALNWAPVPALGVTANVGYEWASASATRERGLTGQAAIVGVALDFDFRAISRVALGLQGQFRWQAPKTSGGLQHVTDLGGGIFYTGREHLALGVQVIDRQFAITPDVNVSWNTWVSEIGLRYYW